MFMREKRADMNNLDNQVNGGFPAMRNNPWTEIELDDYENHMSLDTVFQLQTLNQVMREQFHTYPMQYAVKPCRDAACTN